MLFVSSMIVVLSAASDVQAEARLDLRSDRSERITSVFNKLSADTMDILDDFYADDVAFADPLGPIQGLADLRAYYTKLYERATQVSFEFHDAIAQGDTHVVTWTMRFTPEKMNKGREVSVEGNSVIRFGDNDKVVYHRDYFDMNELIYQHVPVLKRVTRYVNNRMSKH